MNIAIIPARSGSKGLKDKNIKNLAGKPLIWYSIRAAKDAAVFDTIMVSTDSKDYADIAVECGAEVPFFRSEKTASDTASSWDAVREVLEKYRDFGKEFETVCLLQPTSPLRTAEDILHGYDIYKKKKCNAVVAVCEADHSPRWMNTLPESGCMDSFIRKEDVSVGRQLLQTYYRINGALYIVKTERIIDGLDLYENSYACIMPRNRSVDIDTELDFIVAESIYRTM